MYKGTMYKVQRGQFTMQAGGQIVRLLALYKILKIVHSSLAKK